MLSVAAPATDRPALLYRLSQTFNPLLDLVEMRDGPKRHGPALTIAQLG